MAERKVAAGAGSIFEQRHEAAAGEVSGRRQAGEISKRRVNVNVFDNARRGPAGLGETRRADHERNAGIEIPVGAFAPPTGVAERKAVIAPKDDDGVPLEFETPKGVEHPTDLGVDVAHAGIIAVA